MHVFDCAIDNLCELPLNRMNSAKLYTLRLHLTYVLMNSTKLYILLLHLKYVVPLLASL